MNEFSTDVNWLSAASALRGQNRAPVEVTSGAPARYTRSPTPVVRIANSDPVEVLRQSLDASLTWWGVAKLPISWATGNIQSWFEEYVYTPAVAQALTPLRPSVAWLGIADYAITTGLNAAQLIAIGFGKSWGVKPVSSAVYAVARSRAARAAALAFGRSLLSCTKGIFEAALRRLGAIAARHYAALAAGPTPLGVIVHGALVVVDAATVLDCASDILNIRRDLIQAICECFGAPPDHRSVWRYLSREVLSAHIDS